VAELADLPAGRQARGTEPMFYVYVIESLKKKFSYVGLTKNSEGRIEQHFEGKEQTTAPYLPFKLAHVEVVADRKRARELEKFFKSGFGREIIKEIEEQI
jgi:putative endonuclease